MTERLQITSTYYPPTGEDTRKVSFDATFGTFYHMAHKGFRGRGDYYSIIVYRDSQKIAQIKLGDMNKEHFPPSWW